MVSQNKKITLSKGCVTNGLRLYSCKHTAIISFGHRLTLGCLPALLAWLSKSFIISEDAFGNKFFELIW